MRSLFWVEPGRIGSLLDRIDDPETPATEAPREAPSPSHPSPPESSPASVASDSEATGDRPRNETHVSSARDAARPTTAPSTPEDQGRSIEDRLQAVIARPRAASNAEGVFIADGDGLLVVADGISPEIAAASSALTRAWASVREPLAAANSFVSMELESGKCLHLLHVVTDLGPFCLGLVAARAPGRSDANSIADALRRAIDERQEEKE